MVSSSSRNRPHHASLSDAWKVMGPVARLRESDIPCDMRELTRQLPIRRKGSGGSRSGPTSAEFGSDNEPDVDDEQRS